MRIIILKDVVSVFIGILMGVKIFNRYNEWKEDLQKEAMLEKTMKKVRDGKMDMKEAKEAIERIFEK